MVLLHTLTHRVARSSLSTQQSPVQKKERAVCLCGVHAICTHLIKLGLARISQCEPVSTCNQRTRRRTPSG